MRMTIPFLPFMLSWLPALLLTACITIPTVPSPEFRRGAATLGSQQRVVVFAPRCEGAADACTEAFRSALLGRLVSELESRGIRTIRAEELLATARERTVASGSLGSVGATNSTTGKASIGAFALSGRGSVEKGGAGYDDLPPAARRDLLAQAQADGVVRINVFVNPDSPQTGAFYDLHLFETTVRLGAGADEAFVWSARCSAVGESTPAIGGPNKLYPQAADDMARCVVQSAFDR